MQWEKQLLTSVTPVGISGASVRLVQPEKQPLISVTPAGILDTWVRFVQFLKQHCIFVTPDTADNLSTTFFPLLSFSICPSRLGVDPLPFKSAAVRPVTSI